MTQPVYDRRKISPSEKKFRRGLYAMLITLGLLAAGGFIYGKQTRAESLKIGKAAAQTRESAERNEIKNQHLIDQLDRLIAQLEFLSKQSAARERNANRERDELKRRIEQLEAFITELLAKQDGTRDAVDRLRSVQRSQKTRTVVVYPSPSPSPQPPPPSCIKPNGKPCKHIPD